MTSLSTFVAILADFVTDLLALAKQGLHVPHIQ